MTVNGYGVSLGDDKPVLELGSGDGYITSECNKNPLNCTLLKNEFCSMWSIFQLKNYMRKNIFYRQKFKNIIDACDNRSLDSGHHISS